MPAAAALFASSTVLAVLAAPDELPQLPSRFTVSFGDDTQSSSLSLALRHRLGKAFGKFGLSDDDAGLGTLYYDAAQKRYHIDFKEYMDDHHGDKYPLKLDYFADEKQSYILTNGQCLKDPPYLGIEVAAGGFAHLFGWLEQATFDGQDLWHNRTCTRWYEPAKNSTLCLAGDLPVYLDVREDMPPNQDMTRFSFNDDLIRSADAAHLPEPVACTGPPPVCGSSDVKLMDIYLFHPRSSFNISGQDAADLHGDADYLCSGEAWKIEDYQLASHYELSVVQTFGQYANCNFYNPSTCYGGDGFHVGREAPAGYGKHAGQCDDDADLWDRLGVWYSLPEGGLCRNDFQTLGHDCTWRIERRVKTFEMSCLFDAAHNFQELCKSTTPPFSDVTAALLKAYAFEGASEGGCPSLKEPGSLFNSFV